MLSNHDTLFEITIDIAVLCALNILSIFKVMFFLLFASDIHLRDDESTLSNVNKLWWFGNNACAPDCQSLVFSYQLMTSIATNIMLMAVPTEQNMAT